jgi:hypothetical protein
MRAVLREGSQRCPAHEDRTASLSVTRARDGRWLLYCHAGCQTKKVLETLGLTWADLFPTPLERIPKRAPRPRPRSLLNEARGEVLSDAIRAQEKLDRYSDVFQWSDEVREAYRVLDNAKRLVTRMGDSEPAWILARAASILEREVMQVEILLDEEAAALRRR